MSSKKYSKLVLCLIIIFTFFPNFGKGQTIQAIYPTKDAFVSDAYPNDNYGTHPWLWISNRDDLSSGICQSFIYFNLPPDYHTYSRINLRFYIVLLDTLHTFSISFYKINQPWNETILTWSGRPSLGDLILTKAVENNKIYEISIKNHLTSRDFSIGITAEDSRLNFAEIASKDHDSVINSQKLAVVLNNEDIVVIMSVVGIVAGIGIGVGWFIRNKRIKARNNN
ncbi:MAG: CBM96 family carbohydrate-binding protein [Promethearchaeota archaeon]|jgi:hypothetical protein